MYCRKCGEALPDGAKFCRRCGAPVADPDDTTGAPVTDPILAAPENPTTAPESSAQPVNPGTVPGPDFDAAFGVTPAAETAPEDEIPAANGENAAPVTEADTSPANDAFTISAADVSAADGNVAVIAGTADTVPAKKSKKTLFAVLIGVAAALVIAGVLLFTNLFRSPAGVFRRVQQKTLLDPAKTVCAAYSKSKALGAAGFSNDLTVTLSTSDEESAALMKAFSFALKINIDENGNGMYGVDVNYTGSPILSGTVVGSKDSYGLYIPALDENYYTISKDALNRFLSDDDEGMLGTLEEDTNLTEVAGELPVLLQKYGDIVLSVVKNSNVTKKNETLTLEDSSSVSCTTYTFRPAAGDISTMLKNLAKTLKNDQDAQEKLFVLSNISATANGSASIDFEDFRTQLNARLDDMAQNADSLGASLADAGFAWSASLKGSTIVQERIFANNGELLLYQGSGSLKDGRSDLLRFGSAFSGFTFTNKVTKTDNTYSGQLILNNSSDIVTLQYEADAVKKSGLGLPYGSYSFRSDEGSSEMTLWVGDGQNGGSSYNLVINDQWGNLLTFDVTSTDKPSTITAPTASPVDVSNYSEDQLNDIYSNMLYSLYELLYTMDY